MASGRAHEDVTVCLSAIPLTLGLLGGLIDLRYSIFMSLGCLLGVWLSPDLDVDGMTLSKKRMLQIPIAGRFVKWYWQRYSLRVAHRSWVSHAPIVGTLIRTVYGLWWLAIAAYYVNYWTEFEYLIYGLIVVDTAHWAIDISSTAIKKTIRRFKL